MSVEVGHPGPSGAGSLLEEFVADLRFGRARTPVLHKLSPV